MTKNKLEWMFSFPEFFMIGLILSRMDFTNLKQILKK